MPSIDDLVISLRIDEGSNLAKLKKQLDALVGPEGRRTALATGGMGIPQRLVEDIREIKQGVSLITPMITPQTKGELQANALALMKRMQKVGLEALAERGEVDIGVIKDFLSDLELIVQGVTTKKTGMFLGALELFIKEVYEKGGLAVTRIKEVMKRTSEQQKAIEQFFKEMGVDVLAQVYSRIPRKNWQERVSGDIEKELKGILKNADKNQEIAQKINEYLKTVNELEFWKDPMKYMPKLYEVVGKDFTKRAIRGGPKTSEEKVIAAKVIEASYKFLTPIMGDIWKWAKEKVLKNIMPKEGEFDWKRIDVVAFGEITERLFEKLPQWRTEIEKIDGVMTGIEVKKEAVKETIDQLNKYTEFFGTNIALITKLTSKQFEADLHLLGDSVVVIKESMAGLMGSLGIVKDYWKDLEEIDKTRPEYGRIRLLAGMDMVIKILRSISKNEEEYNRNVEAVKEALEAQASQDMFRINTAPPPDKNG